MNLIVSIHGVVEVLKLAHGRERRSLQGYLRDWLVLGLLSSALRLLVPLVRVGMGHGEGAFGLGFLVGSRSFASGRHGGQRGGGVD